MNIEDLLPDEPCLVGQHVAAVVHRCGGKDADYYNVCGKCGREIERGDGEPWATAQQIEDYIGEQIEENRREWEAEQYEALHPEARCPPRE